LLVEGAEPGGGVEPEAEGIESAFIGCAGAEGWTITLLVEGSESGREDGGVAQAAIVKRSMTRMKGATNKKFFLNMLERRTVFNGGIKVTPLRLYRYKYRKRVSN